MNQQDSRTAQASPRLGMLNAGLGPMSTRPGEHEAASEPYETTGEEVPTYTALGFEMAAITKEQAIAKILEYSRKDRSHQIHLCNAYTLTLAQQDAELAQALRSSDLNIPDGTPVAWLGRKAGTRGPVRGPGLTVDVFLAGVTGTAEPGVRHYLYGGAEGVATRMAAKLKHRQGRIRIVGIETPPFRALNPTELDELAERINESGADITWIGLGTPRQDYLVAALAPLVQATLVPVGAAFDFISGTVAEAPQRLHGSGFEWLYRFAREPRRLWRRYTLDGAKFALYLLRSQRLLRRN